MSEPSDWALLTRYLAGECTGPEKIRVEAWMAADPENRMLVEQIQIIWETPTPKQEDVDVKQLWYQVADQIGLQRESAMKRFANWLKNLSGMTVGDGRFQPSRSPALRYAAITLLVIALPLLVARWGWNRTMPQLTTVQISKAERNQIVFSDGSSVILDAGTTLRYPERFDQRTREIYLDGEGFFEITADTRRPFIIHASDALIQVLGTKFNVRAWEPDERVQVAVSEGLVSFRPVSTPIEEGVIIHEGESSLMPINGQPTEPEEVDISEHLGWMQNDAVFRDVPLHEVLFQVERWYNLSFELSDPLVADERVTMHIRRNSVDDVLELISVLSGLAYRRDGRIIRLGLPDMPPEQTEKP